MVFEYTGISKNYIIKINKSILFLLAFLVNGCLPQKKIHVHFKLNESQMEDKFVINSIKAEKYIQFFEIKKYQEKCIQIEIEAKQQKKYSFDLDTIKKSIVKEAYQSGLEPQIQNEKIIYIQ